MQIKKVACVGIGLIGHSWATIFCINNLDIFLMDVSEEILTKAVECIKTNLLFLEQKGLIQKGKARLAHMSIKITTDLEEAVSNSDYVQESIPDTYEEKKKVFKEMDTYAPKETILASSSSGLRMTEIQKATTRPNRCVMAHPILPPHLIPLVEIVGGDKTSAETILTTRDFMKKLGKVPVVLNKEVPGYIVNRFNAAIWREAISLVANGVANAEDVDKAFCMGIGLRDPIFGPCLRAHVAGNGIDHFIDNYKQSYNIRWKSMETWAEIPNSAIKKIIESTLEMEAMRKNSIDEIKRQRDEKLIELFKTMQPKHPFY